MAELKITNIEVLERNTTGKQIGCRRGLKVPLSASVEDQMKNLAKRF
jgi:hypothetical protein